MIFVDTNYFLRYLRNDIPTQSLQAKDLFLRAAAGEVELCTSLIVVFEIFLVMDHFYQECKQEKIKVMRSIMSLGFLLIPERSILQRAISIFEQTSLEFEDCYNLAFIWENEVDELKTFDKKLQRYAEKSGLTIS